MPTYQYACTECSHAFEQVQSFSDDALSVCPACQGRLRKVFNAVGVVFKGSGFYRTDSRSAASASDGSSSSTTTEGSSSTGSGEGGATKTDSTPAPKSDPKPAAAAASSSSSSSD